MLWIVGGLTLVIWLVLALVLHKGGFVHVVLLLAIAFFVSQFVQDRRTRAYKSDR